MLIIITKKREQVAYKLIYLISDNNFVQLYIFIYLFFGRKK